LRGVIEGERKQVTVLFCDIVESTPRAASLGPEGFHELVERFFQGAMSVVHRYGGTINQFLGDGFMALFGAPVAHEDHGLRGVNAALEVVAESEIPVRIGINSGLVVVGAIGDDLRVDYTAFGDTTILAARLQAVAAPGEVLISERTAASVAGYFLTEPVEPTEVKGRTIRGIRVTGYGPRRSPLETGEELSPFTGRERDLAELRSRLETGLQGEGQLVGVAGEPGLGKTRLAFEFQQLVRGQADVLEGRCLSYGAGIPYLPLLDLLRGICGVQPEDDAAAVRAKVATAVASFELAGDTAEYLLHALGVSTNQSGLTSVDAPTIRARTFDAIRGMLLGKADDRPLLVLIEDLHWIDRTSEQFLSEFADAVASAPILLLATYRSGYTPDWLAKSFASQLSLRPLAPEASEHLTALLLGGRDQDSVTAIAARGEGNPFFLEELARAARQGVTGPGEAVPATVQDVLAARIDHLSPSQKRTLQLAAVLGREFSSDTVRELSAGAADVEAELGQLTRLEFLRRRPAGSYYIFRHALTRDVAYDTLLERQRQRLHELAAATLERAHADRLFEYYELLAYHYSRSANRDRALDYLELANRKASARHALEEAIDYFRQALKTLEQLPDTPEVRRRRIALAVDQMNGFHFLHRTIEYHEMLVQLEPEALALADPWILAMLYCRLGECRGMFGDYAASARTQRQAVQFAEKSGNTESAAASYASLVWSYHVLGDYGSSIEAHRKALQSAAAGFQAWAYQFAQAGVALTYMYKGSWQHALAAADEGIATGEKRADNGIIAFNAIMATLICLEMRDLPRAMTYANTTLAAAPTEYYRGFAYAGLAAALCYRGDLQQGIPILEQLLAVLRQTNHDIGLNLVAPHLADAYLRDGNLAAARDLLEEREQASSQRSAWFHNAAYRRRLAEVALATDDAAQGREWLLPAIQRLRDTGSENELAISLRVLGEAERRLSNELTARGHFEEALDIFHRLGTLDEPELIHALLSR